MTAYLTVLKDHAIATFWYGFVPVFGIVAATTLLALPTRDRDRISFAALFSLLGGTLGLMIGMSREPAVGALLPALLALIGGVILRVFPAEMGRSLMTEREADSQDEPALIRGIVFASISALTLSGLLGSIMGASFRVSSEAAMRLIDREQMLYEKVQLPLELAQIRQAMGLSLEEK